MNYTLFVPRFNESAQQPFLILAPGRELDIRPIILCSKRFGYQVRVKSGGHDYEGLSFRTFRPEIPFIMIDISTLNQTSFDLQEETAWIQTGVTLGQLYYEISKISKVHAFPGGLYPGVGSGGHISGGGLGTLLRKYGLAADNVIDARIMDANGSILDRKMMGEDVFWALRGGGGSSFGVILAWKARLARVPQEVTVFKFRDALNPKNLHVLEKWQNSAYNVTKDLFLRIIVQNIFDPVLKQKVVAVVYSGLFLGASDKLVPLLREIYPEFGFQPEDCMGGAPEPIDYNACANVPYPCSAMQKECYTVPWINSTLYFIGKKVNDPLEILVEKKRNAKGNFKGTSDFLTAPIPDEGWKMIHEMFLTEDKPMMIIDPFGGMMDEIPEDATPFPHRKGNLFNIQYLTYWGYNETETRAAERHLTWIMNLHKAMTPYVAQSPRTSYINYKDLNLGSNDEECSYGKAKIWGEKYFKGNFERLARAKSKVDPENFFRNEQSIPVGSNA